MRLLRRAVRVAEPDVYAARQQLRRVVFGIRAVFLDHLRLGELRAVVGQDRAEEPHEVRVKAVERNVETLDFSNAEAAKFSNKRPRRTSMEFGILSPETA